jgi:hypothetical protein
MFFVQECPRCGRRVEVRVEYLGRLVVCDHCQGRFEATDPTGVDGRADIRSSALLERAEQLLAEVEVQRARHAS